MGFRRLSVSAVTAGSSPPSESSSGAPIGLAASAAAVTPACQSSLSTSTTAVGRVASLVPGKTALATPAASAAASPPPTRIVFLVAVEGKPSLAAASSSSEVVPSCGRRWSGSSPSEQPPSPASGRQGDGGVSPQAHGAAR